MLDATRCRRLIVFGGSFDPPHRAHVAIPLAVADRIDADGVLYIPAGDPPHKPDRTLASPADRLAMLRLALADADPDRVGIDELELHRDGPSYTVDTLAALRERLGEAVDLRLLMGADMMVTFYSWKSPRRILELAEPVVMARPPLDKTAMLARLPADLPDAERTAWADRIVPTRTLDVSSTDLRAKLAAGDYGARLVTGALAPTVLGYIRERGLYRSA